MSIAYYIQFEDKNIPEGANIGTLAGLKNKFAEKLENIVFTNNVDDISVKYRKTGVKTVVFYNDSFALTDIDVIVNKLKEYFNSKEEYIITFEDSYIGNSVGARLAAKLDVPFVAHLDELNAKDGNFIAVKRIGETKALHNIVLPARSVNTISFNGILEGSENTDIDIQGFTYESENDLSYRKNKNINNDLIYAKVVVAGGKGLQTPENVKPLEQLANKLNGSIGASKAITDQGWIDESKMIGISNLTVSPDVYYAIGISGAVQHTAGMDKSKYIVAINSDKSAPIFNLADYGVIGDAKEIMQKMMKIL